SCSLARSRAGTGRKRGFWAACVVQAKSHLVLPSSRAMYSVPVVGVVVVMLRSPSTRKRVSYLTETCTTSDTSPPTWYRTTKLSSGRRLSELETPGNRHGGGRSAGRVAG